VWIYHQVEIIADLLARLHDGNILSLARSASNHFNHSIYRWVTLQDQIFIRNRAATGIATVRIASEERNPENYVPTYSREELFQLTLENVREIAIYEPPSLSEIEPPLREEKRFTLSPTAPPLTLISATTFVELVLLFSLAYFWFFQHEARRSDTFLAPGTLWVNRNKRT
jgi:hypothetical protein